MPDHDPFIRRYYDPTAPWGRGSGEGSSAYSTIPYRAFLEKFMAMNRVSSIIDIGCGDWNFFQYINLADITYYGFDVIPELVEQNQHRYGRNGVSFALMPDDLSQLPDARLVIIKDVLQHLPNRDIIEFRDRVCTRYPITLITNSFEKLDVPKNIDISAGRFRCLDLTIEPYFFDGVYVLEFMSALWERIRTLLCTGGPRAAAVIAS